MTGKTDWDRALRQRCARIARDPDVPSGMAEANRDMVGWVIAGMGPDSTAASDERGARAVANMACDHARAFCSATGPKAYLNAYDLASVKTVSATRQRVDGSLPLPPGCAKEQVCFLAVEVNGAGVRFYGDLCLVLKPSETAPDTRVLNGNSYDLVRLPVSSRTASNAALRAEAQSFWGEWQHDLAAMASLKVFSGRRSERRFTTGQVSDGILDDEDYLEVLRPGSFGKGHLEEVRISAASAAAETEIAERTRHGPTPSAASLLWRKRRREAHAEFAAANIPMRVIQHTGRVKG